MNILFREDIVKLPSIPLCFDDNFGIIVTYMITKLRGNYCSFLIIQ